MNDASIFWLQKPWPADTDPTYTFLGRAVLAYGDARYRGEWTGVEPPAFFADQKLPPLLPFLKSMADYYQIRRAIRQLALRRRDLGYTAVGDLGAEAERLTDEHWQIARQIDREARDENIAAVTRMATTMKALAESFADGGLKFGLRPKIGGKIQPGEPWWWMTELIDRRFYWCQMNPREPITHAIGGDGFYYIYVEVSSFNAFIGALSASCSERSNKPDRSPKKSYSDDEAKAAADNYFAVFDGVTEHECVDGKMRVYPRRDDFEAAMLAKLQGGSTTQIRPLWKRRPHFWTGRRARKGS